MEWKGSCLVNCRKPAGLAVLALFVGVASVARGELVTYRLIDGAAGDQAGHTISGTITLDPACQSSCTELHAWQYTVSGPGLNRSASSDDFPPLIDNLSGLFTATEDRLTVDFRENTNGAQLILDLAGLAWNVEGIPFDLSRQYFGYRFDVPTPAGWSTTPPARVITIAEAVPEPHSAELLVIGCVALVWCRRRQATGKLR